MFLQALLKFGASDAKHVKHVSAGCLASPGDPLYLGWRHLRRAICLAECEACEACEAMECNGCYFNTAPKKKTKRSLIQ